VNRDEALDLLARAAAFDNRMPSKAAAEAWAAALHDIPLDEDALAAVTIYYTRRGDLDGRRWILPFHVRQIRAEARAPRIDRANLQYAGNPDETPIEGIRNLRRLLAAAGDGRPVPPAHQLNPANRRPLELEAGPQGRRLQAALAAIGEAPPPPQVPGVANPFAVGCPKCHALPGRSCTSGRPGKPPRKHADPHPSRTDLAKARAGNTTAEEDTTP
jgi:hypothetical protein